MKPSKIFLTFIIAAVSLSAGARKSLTQETPKEEIKTEENALTEKPEKSDVEPEFKAGWKKKVTDFSFNYIGRFEKTATLNYDMRINIFNVGGGYTVSGGNGWHIYAGAGYRYCFTQNIFIDGAAGIMYEHASYEITNKETETYYVFGTPHTREKITKEKHGIDNVGLYVLPRLGFVTKKGLGIQIGYMMTAPKLKFDRFFDGGAVVLGVVF